MAEVSAHVMKRVSRVAPKGGRCLVENCSENRGVEYAHYIPHKFVKEEQLMCNLEWWWNMGYHTLNLNTRYNIFCLGAALRRMFDNHFWIFVPQEKDVDIYYKDLIQIGDNNLADRTKFPSFNEGQVFQYKLLAMPDKMKNVPIMFQQTVTQPVLAEHFQVHLHPFDTFPLLPSHIRPHFVIYQAGRVLAKLFATRLIRIVEENPLLRKVLALYDAWRTDPPAGVMDDKGFNPAPPLEEDKDDITDTERTAHTRGVCVTNRAQPRVM